MANYLKLAFNRQAPNQLAIVGGFAAAMPVFFQFDVKDLIIQVFDPSQAQLTGAQAFNPVDLAGDIMRVTMSGTPAGNAAPTILAQNTNLVWNATPGNVSLTGNQIGYFSGTLDLTSVALANFIAGGSAAQPYLEFALRENGVTKPLWSQQVTVLAVPDQGQASGAAAQSLFATLAEVKAGFMAKYGTGADSKIWLSPDGTKAVRQYLDNNGRMQYDPIVPAPAAQ